MRKIFDDVNDGDWFVNDVQYVYDRFIMIGMGDIFGTMLPLTRERAVYVLYSHYGRPDVEGSVSWQDVDTKLWYGDAAIWANENGVADGYSEETFGVGDAVTREQFALMLYKYALLRGYDTTYTEGMTENFSDADSVSYWAAKAVNWALSQGIIVGKGNGSDISTYRLDPQGTATGAECACMIRKFMEVNE